MSSGTIGWLTGHARTCSACAVDVRTLLQTTAAQNKLLQSVVSRREEARRPEGEEAPLLPTRGLPVRFSSVLDRVSIDAAQSLSETARRSA